MKRFYLSTDGFILSWSYQYSRKIFVKIDFSYKNYKFLFSANDIRKVGNINIPNLLKISLLKENLESLMPQITTVPSSSSNNYPVKINIATNGPLMNSRTKIFELSGICDIAKVCLVYESPDLSNPKVYLLEKLNFKWQFLADTFTEYLRMTIAHLGLPYWELCFSSCGLPSWTEQLFLLIAPHLLERNEPRRSKVIQCDPETPPFNTLDPVVFRTKPRCSRQVLKGR